MDRQSSLRQLPAVGLLLSKKDLVASGLPKWALTKGAQMAVSEARQAILNGKNPPQLNGIVDRALFHARVLAAPSLKGVINATGVVLHTNLGRAPLAQRAAKAVLEVASTYNNLEYDIEAGRRGSRRVHAQRALCELTGAEAAMVVNNNAAAVFLALTALAKGKEVVVSRGELVEIGGSFRIPDILEAGGAHLKEVGTTNRTRIADYERAIHDETALLLKVHTSNFTIQGFTESTSRASLVELGRRRGLLVMEDLGSGLLQRRGFTGKGAVDEPLVSEVVKAGVDVITFSGDKLVGGPQAGIILGSKAVIQTLSRHPLARAMRVCKMTLAALEATLALYLEGRAEAEIPVFRALTGDAARLKSEAEALKSQLEGGIPHLAAHFDLALCENIGRVGGGSLPDLDLQSTALVLTPRAHRISALEAHLRAWQPAIIARIQDDALWLDPRTLLPGDGPIICEALAAFCAQNQPEAL